MTRFFALPIFCALAWAAIAGAVQPVLPGASVLQSVLTFIAIALALAGFLLLLAGWATRFFSAAAATPALRDGVALLAIACFVELAARGAP